MTRTDLLARLRTAAESMLEGMPAPVIKLEVLSLQKPVKIALGIGCGGGISMDDLRAHLIAASRTAFPPVFADITDGSAFMGCNFATAPISATGRTFAVTLSFPCLPLDLHAALTVS